MGEIAGKSNDWVQISHAFFHVHIKEEEITVSSIKQHKHTSFVTNFSLSNSLPNVQISKYNNFQLLFPSKLTLFSRCYYQHKIQTENE